MLWYNAGVSLYSTAIHLAAPFNDKAKRWVSGRKGLLDRLRDVVAVGESVVWIHAASLGEFEQGRPIIEEIRERYPQYKILLTFFSPSGY